MGPLDIIESIAASKRPLHVTALCMSGTEIVLGPATFGPDNMRHFPEWAEAGVAALQGTRGSMSLVVRLFTDKKHSRSGLPIKLVAGCFLTAAGARYEEAEGMREAMGTDCRTAQPRDIEPEIVFMGFEDLLAAI